VNPVALHAFNPGPITGDGNWTWLLPGAVPTLIDAGTGDARHLDALEHALAGARLAQVLVTHSHVDHASGAAEIANRMPGARFRKMPWAERDTKWRVSWEPIADGEVISAGDTSLLAVHTPGHAPDHLCFWHPETRALFCGDLAVEGTTVWIPSSLRGDLSDYLESLERVLALDPERMFPAHGPVIEQPEKLLRRYIAHRHEREEQALDALRRGDTTPDAIVTRIYKSLAPSLLPMARENVLAQLIKLEREGRARREGDGWQLHDKSSR
jgi:glyoxylase-like metal-dependent hydrolase (beta-lactamase superfamily II)